MNSADLSAIVLSLNYAPEPTGIAPYSSKLSEGLRTRGFRIQVFSGYPHYPGWTVHPDYRGLTYRHRVNGINVQHLRHRIPASPITISRMHMELSYGVRTLLARWNRPDVALTVSPALFATGLAVLKARILRIPIGVWVQDLYTRGLEETKGTKTLTSRLMAWAEGKILRSATGVSVIHERFREYVVNELKVPADRVTVIRNWSHIVFPSNFDRAATRRDFGWSEDEIVVLHAGNMGVKQNLENVIAAAKESEARASPVRFVLLGHGNQREALTNLAKGVGNITFLDTLPDDEFTGALRSADVLLVNEMPGVKEMSVPSKLTSYFATRVPIIAATEIDSATADEIRASGAGLQVAPGQPTQLLNMIEELATSPELSARCASAGLPYVENVLSRDRAIDAYSKWLKSLAESVR